MAFLFVIFFSDMVIKISNFDNFDIQNLLRECFSILRLILLQKISILGSVDNAENVKRFFFWTSNILLLAYLIASEHATKALWGRKMLFSENLTCNEFSIP